MTLDPKHIDELVRGSAISESVLARAGVHSVSHVPELRKMLAQQKRPFAEGQLPALVFPYRRPGCADAVLYAVKPAAPWVSTDRHDGEKSTKYVRTTGVLAPYIPPSVLEAPELLDDRTRPVWITEGEKKTLSLDSAGLVAIGTCGVDCWGPRREVRKAKRLFPEIERACRNAGEVFIVYDSDRETNMKGVRRAENALATAIADAGGRAFVVRLPPGPAKADGTHEKVGVDDYLRDHGRQALEQLAAESRRAGPVRQADAPVELEKLERIVDQPGFENAPVGDARLPPDYRLSRDGSLERTGDGRVAHAPIFIDRILTDATSGQVRVRVRFRVDGVWRTEIVERLAICDARELVKRLAPSGAPVSSNVSKAIVGWLTAYEAVNRPAIPRATLLTAGGWQTLTGRRVFVLGGDAIAAPGIDVADLEIDRSAHPHIAGAVRVAGSRDLQLALTKRIFEAHIAAATVVMAAFAAPLAALLDVPAPAVHIVGPSSRGKTTAAQVAAAVYGMPDSTRADSMLLTWRSTPNALAQRALAANHLPLCLDEAGELRDPVERQDAVYGLVNGHEKARATREGGLRREAAWKVGLVSTGEMPLVDESARTGAHARLIQLRMDDLGELGAIDVDALKSGALAHHGHLGREWVSMLCGVNTRDLVQRLEKLRSTLQGMSSTTVEARGMELIAVLALAEQLAFERFGIGKPGGNTMLSIPAFADRVEVVPEWERALQVLEQLVASQQEAFPVIVMDGSGTSSSGWKFAGSKPARTIMGYLPEGRDEYWLLPGPLAAELTKHNLTLAGCAREWRTHDRLQSTTANDPKHALQRRASLPEGRRAWVYVVVRGEAQTTFRYEDAGFDDEFGHAGAAND